MANKRFWMGLLVMVLLSGTVFAQTIESRIDGNFEGWTGDTVFTLINGQIWQQAEYNYYYHYAYNPKVVIFKDGSYYYMIVDGTNRKIKVKRIK